MAMSMKPLWSMVDIDSAEGDSDAEGVDTFGDVKAVTTNRPGPKLLPRNVAMPALFQTCTCRKVRVWCRSMAFQSWDWWNDSRNDIQDKDDDTESWGRWRGDETEDKWNVRPLEIAEKNWEEQRNMTTEQWNKSWGKKANFSHQDAEEEILALR